MELKEIYQKLEKIELLISLSKKVLTVEETALFCNLSVSYIYKLTHTNQIPFYKPIGKKIYFKRKEIENWLLQNRNMTTNEIDKKASTYIVLNKGKLI